MLTRRNRRSPQFTAGRLLALVGVIGLLLETASTPAIAGTPCLVLLLVIIVLALVAGIAFNIRLVNSLVAVGGVAILMLHVGTPGTFTLILLVALLGWLLGLILRWRR